MRAVATALALAAAALASPALAQEREDDICVSIGTRWRAWGDETRTIATAPVPESFRRMIAATGCARWQLIEASLIDWHLNFGDERSTTAALRFLAATMTAEHPAPPDLAGAITRAYREARDDIGRVRTIRMKSPVDWDASWAVVARSRRIAALQGLLSAFEAQVRIASLYQRAAEQFRSPDLFAEGASHATAAELALAVLQSTGLIDDTTGVIQISAGSGHAVDDMILRRTILRASLSGAGADLMTAGDAVRARSTPALDSVGDLKDGVRICGSNRDPDLAALRAACNDIGNFDRLARDYWVAKGLLDIAVLRAASCDDISVRPAAVDQALSRLAAEIDPEQDGFGWSEYLADRMVGLLIARAEALTRDGCAVPARLFAAAGDLARAQRLLQPSESPSWFRTVAERILVLAPSLRKFGAGATERNAAYLRLMLAHLDAIASAGPGPTPMP